MENLKLEIRIKRANHLECVSGGLGLPCPSADGGIVPV